MRRLLMVVTVLFAVSVLATSQEEYSPVHYTIRLNTDTNLRAEPDRNADLIATAPAQTVLTVTGETDDWLLVTYQEHEVWMANWLGHTPLPPPVTQALIDNPIAPLIPFSRLPECTADDYDDVASSELANGVFSHLYRVAFQHVRGATLSSHDYLLHRDAIWSVAPICSPLFEAYVWLTLSYAETLLINYQLDVAPEARDDPRVAALHEAWNTHPLGDVGRTLSGYWVAIADSDTE